MTFGFAKLLTTFSVIAAVHSAQCRAVIDETRKINQLIANYATQLDVGTVSLNWNEQARKVRDDKLAVLLKDQAFVSELIKFRNGKDLVTRALANVTTMLALIETCTANATLCIKMQTH